MRYLSLITAVGIVVLMISCQKNETSGIIEETSTVSTERSLTPTTGSPYFTAR